MSSEWELDEGIKSIKSAWLREHTARSNLEKMLEQAEAENTKLRELAGMMLSRFMDSLPDSTEKPCDLCDMWDTCNYVNDRQCRLLDSLRELGIKVDGWIA